MNFNRRLTWGLIIVFLVMFHTGASGKALFYENNFAPGTEPDGFDRIKWGTNIATLNPWKNMTLLRKVGLSTFYKRKKEDLKFGMAQIDEIIYEFWDGRFAMVTVRTRGYSNYSFLREYCFTRFGRGVRTASNERLDVQDFFWNGFQTKMSLTYNERTMIGVLRMVSIKMENRRNRMLNVETEEELKEEYGQPRKMKGGGKKAR